MTKPLQKAGEILRSIAKAILWPPFTAWQRQHSLAALDDRQLADIGFTRVARGYQRHPDTFNESTVLIRDSSDSDIQPVADIYAHYVKFGSASFEEVPPATDEMAARRGDVLARGLPYLVAEVNGKVVGYSYATPYRSRSAYRFTIENSVYVDHSVQRCGIGRALMAALIRRCENGPWRQMIAVIGDSSNEPSIGLHEKLGFARIGTLRSVGWKFRSWTDTVLMQRPLGSGDSTSIE